MLVRIHRWLGLTLALFALLASVSGALLLWSDEYHRWRYPELGQSEGVTTARAEVIRRLLDHSPGPVAVLALPTPALPAYRAYLQDGSEALFETDQGLLVDHWSGLERLPAFLFELHVRLLGGEAGHQLVGVIGLLFLVLLLSGPFLWWPRRHVLKLRRWWPARATGPRLINAHAAQGMLLGSLIGMLALTGAAVVFHQQASALLDGALGKSGPTRPATTAVPDGGLGVDWTAALAAAQAHFPEGTLRLAMLPQSAGEPLVLRIRQRGEWHPNGRSYLVLHPQSGQLLERIDATQTGNGPAVYNALYPLHAGKTGWPGYRAVLLLASLALTSMVVSALWRYLRRRQMERGAKV